MEDRLQGRRGTVRSRYVGVVRHDPLGSMSDMSNLSGHFEVVAYDPSPLGGIKNAIEIRSDGRVICLSPLAVWILLDKIRKMSIDKG
jgi:hypothetical protein